MDRIRLVLADDHLNVRNQIRTRLEREPRFDVVAEASDSSQAIQCTIAARPHVLLIDPMMRDGMGLQALHQIAARLPRTAIIVLTAFADTALQIDLKRSGVSRVLNKGLESRRLVDVLTEIGVESINQSIEGEKNV